MKITPIFLLTPNNFQHKAGDGKKTRKHGISTIHPTLQANPGSTQMSYLLEMFECDKDEDMNNEKIVCESRVNDGLRTFKDNIIGTIRTIDSGEIKE